MKKLKIRNTFYEKQKEYKNDPKIIYFHKMYLNE